MYYKFKPDAAQTIAMAGISQADLARSADVNHTNLSTQLRHLRPMRMTTAARIARAYAEAAKITQQDAMEALFVEETRE